MRALSNLTGKHVHAMTRSTYIEGTVDDVIVDPHGSVVAFKNVTLGTLGTNKFEWLFVPAASVDWIGEAPKTKRIKK